MAGCMHATVILGVEMSAELEASNLWWLLMCTGGLISKVSCGSLAGIDKIGVVSVCELLILHPYNVHFFTHANTLCYDCGNPACLLV